MSDHLQRFGLTESYHHPVAEYVAAEKAAFIESLEKMGENPPGGSVALSEFSKAALTDLSENQTRFPELGNLVDAFIEQRPDMDGAYKVQHFWRTFQSYLIDTDRPHYPREYICTTWQGVFRSMLRDPERVRDIEQKLWTRNNQANEPRRYAGLKLAMAINRPPLPSKPTLVDAGCSAGLGPVQILKNINFENVRFDTEDCTVAEYLQRRLAGKLALGTTVGFDSEIIDKATIDWVEANSYYPSELLDNRKRSHRKRLYRARRELTGRHLPAEDQRFKVELANLIPYDDRDDDTLESVRSHVPGGKYDVAAALTTLYEMPEEDRLRAIKQLASLADKMIFVQDFAYRDPDDPSHLIFPGIYTTPYTAFIRLPDDPENTWHELGQWDSGRCYAFTPSKLLENICHQRVMHQKPDFNDQSTTNH